MNNAFYYAFYCKLTNFTIKCSVKGEPIDR